VPYVRAERPKEATAPPVPHHIFTNTPGLAWDSNCESWFGIEELEILRRYFARHVYRDNLTFHEWMKPRITRAGAEALLSAEKHFT
jgi:hypothetical protein